MNKMHSDDLFDSLKCPITYELFREPVIGSDGHTYERENITTWIRQHGTSPITREPMNLNSLRSNFIVKKMVEDFMTLSLEKRYQFRLDVDVSKSNPKPIFQSSNKTIYQAKWISKHGPPIVLIKIDGTTAKCEASFYVKLSCHPHIVRTYGLVDNHSSNSIMLVQEYAPEGDLNKLLCEKHFRPTMEVLVEIFLQIVDAMICLADNQIIHGDLACRNVLVFRSSVNQSTNILVKLTDFGLTHANSLFSLVDLPTSTMMTRIPIRSIAPEILREKSSNSYSEKSDVYSFGVLMWEACSNGAMPYGELKKLDEVYQMRMKGIGLGRPNICADKLWEIIVDCMQYEIQKRPNFKTIQDNLLNLRFENRRASASRISQIESMYMNIPSKTFDSEKDAYLNLPVYNNLMAVSDTYAVPQSDYSKKIICEFCSQSVMQDDFMKHQNVCSVRSTARSFAKSFVKLPLLQIVSCPFCDNIIPLNMLRIHKFTCSKTAPWPDESQILIRSSTENTYPTLNYLKPTPFLNPPSKQTVPEHGQFPERTMQRSNSNFAIQTEKTNKPSSSPEIQRKSSKRGLRKLFSKWKKNT